jgi:hypothetical protein
MYEINFDAIAAKMRKIFTVQEIVDLFAFLYDNGQLTRSALYNTLTALYDDGRIEGSYDVDRLFDLIIG